MGSIREAGADKACFAVSGDSTFDLQQAVDRISIA
jgi:hypothetical protein